ncbi:MAG: helix-turn-helix domain-containing protein [Christensenellaceae bacterium]|nr:helix-turn-helix domain-containing protein [Christensenellaceae bacterium]
MDFKERFSELLGSDTGAQAAIVAAIGAKSGLVSEWHSGKKKPGFDYLVKLSEYFSVTTDYLMGLSNERSAGVSGLSGQEVELLGMFRDLPNDALRAMVFQQVRVAVTSLAGADASDCCGEKKEESLASLRRKAE